MGNRIAQRLMLKLGDRVNIEGGTGNLQLRIAGLFETGVSQIDKNACIFIYLPLKRFWAKDFLVQFSNYRCSILKKHQRFCTNTGNNWSQDGVSWQEREQVWLGVFKALRISSAITVSSILLLSGLGIFNVFAIMVMEKTRDIAILRSIGFKPSDISSIFLARRYNFGNWNNSWFMRWHFINLWNF